MNLLEMLWVNYIKQFNHPKINFSYFFKGASAGAGSGEFDIYRGCRRRQMIREEYIKEMAEQVFIIFIFLLLIG